jgi:hypothetical protein
MRSGTIKLARGALSLTVSLLSASVASAQESESAVYAEQQPESHAVGNGDTLWGISGRYLGSSYEWPRLWSYNPEITNPHWIYPGHVLRLREGAPGGYTGAPGTPVPTAAGGALRGRLLRRGSGLAERRGTVIVGEQVYLDKDALGHAARIVGSPDDHMMFSPTDEVYLKFKDDAQLPEGRELLVFRRMKRSEVSPKAGYYTNRIYHADEGGEIVRVLGALRVQHVDPDKRIARAVVTEAMDPIERGFEVADVPRTLADVPPKPSTRKVEAQIVAATRELGTLGENQLVFINAGKNQGVEVGNRFLVVRQGDPWRQNLHTNERLSGEVRPERKPLPSDAFPWEVVGELRTLYVRADSSTALITDSLVELNPGDRVELREGY